jgi:hypothetical protein
MRTFIEITRFELRQQFTSPFVWAGLIVSFLLHFFTIGSVGISLWAHPQANLNSAYAIAVVHTTLTIVELLPVIVFVAGAVLRDQEQATVELFVVKPIRKWQYLGGRFCAVFLLAIWLGLWGIVGSILGTGMPWVDAALVAPFSLKPYLFCFCCIVLPNLLILCALFFSVAMRTHSLAATVSLAVILITFDFVLAGYKLNADVSPGLLALADHSGILVVSGASRNLTVAELNTLYPTRLMFENRLIWLVLSFAILIVSFIQSDIRSGERRIKSWLRRFQSPGQQTPSITVSDKLAISSRSKLAALFSQFRMDCYAVLVNPLFLLLLVLSVIAAVSDYNDHMSPIMKSSLYPVTSARLGFFRYGLLQLAIVMVIYFPAMLVHRERASDIAELTDASPMSGWILPVSKTLAICTAMILFLSVAMLTAMVRQSMAGPAQLEVGLYLRTVFLNNGFYYCMLCILATLIQALVPNKWVGMLLVLVLILLTFNLPAMGWEHILYRFMIPETVYSDMNGFGAAGRQVNSLIGYWGFFCGLLVVAAYLFYPRGTDGRLQTRLSAAAKKGQVPMTAIVALLLFSGFCTMGGYIFYNTNVLNSYRTVRGIRQAKASYEIKYGSYEALPAPSFKTIDIAIDLFPEQRRLVSHGTTSLINNKKFPITEFVISVDPRLTIHQLEINAATLVKADSGIGFYLYKTHQPLQPDSVLTMRWYMSRQNRGFVNGEQDAELLENGTYITSYATMPMPGFDDTHKLTNNKDRREWGLAETTGLPALGDPRYLDRLLYGVDSRSDLHIVVSTSGDQIAVAPGRLQRNWQKNGRNYFEYSSERPIWSKLHFISARYQVAREKWSNGKQAINLEIYYDPKHSYNVGNMLSTARRSLDYLTREFAPYQYSYVRIMEYPNYRMAAQTLAGEDIVYSEAIGWIADLKNLQGIDYTTIHELSHKWWGEQALGAKMQGREVLNETLAQYSTLMIYQKFDEQHPGANLAKRIIADWQTNYLQARNKDAKPERPLLYTDAQGYVTYYKGALALYTLQELMGEDKVNRALRNYLHKFAFQPAPFPTSRDLVNELRAVAGAEYQDLITDLFEKVITYDLELTNASAVKTASGFRIVLTIVARQLEADDSGKESPTPLKRWVDLALFANVKKDPNKQVPLYLEKHLLRSGVNTITITVKQKPAFVSIDPFLKMADKEPDNNSRVIK